MSDEWRHRLRGDPTNWLLDPDDNPSVYFWFLRDIVGRPEDAPALLEARERILYSAPVQALFATQSESGFWEDPASLDEPRYRATLWQLARLAELGAPRRSRRARAACEFALQNHLASTGAFQLRDPALAGLLIRALLYFGYADDARLSRALDGLCADAARGNLFALWALAELPPARRDAPRVDAVTRGAAILLDALARGEWATFGAFPPFDARDAVLALRVLAMLGRARDPRARPAIEELWRRQEEGARWRLEKSYDGSLTALREDVSAPSKWATLDALRIVTRT